MIRKVGFIIGLAVLNAPSAGASEFSASASVGVAAYSYEYSYPYEDYNGDNQISEYDEDIDFSYQDFSIGFPNENGSSWSFKMGSGEDSNYSSSFDQSNAEREEYSVTYTQAFSEKSSWFWGYYESYADLYHMRETDIFGIDYTFHFDTEIETGGLFLGASTNDTLNQYSSWYFRGALQVNWTEFSDSYRWENENGESGGEPFSKDLTGVAFLLGAGVYVPITDAAGINFGLETKSYDYDNELDAIYEETTTLSENQTSLIVSLSLGF